MLYYGGKHSGTDLRTTGVPNRTEQGSETPCYTSALCQVTARKFLFLISSSLAYLLSLYLYQFTTNFKQSYLTINFRKNILAHKLFFFFFNKPSKKVQQ